MGEPRFVTNFVQGRVGFVCNYMVESRAVVVDEHLGGAVAVVVVELDRVGGALEKREKQKPT